MKQHIVLLSVFLMTLTPTLFGQKNANSQESVIQYGPHAVSYEEFKRGFMKNQTRESVVYSAQDVQDYLELYTNFKLKVQDAYDRGLDTTRNFKGELNV
jgi:peptidyl-prolyl cis-trans isomerase SurA